MGMYRLMTRFWPTPRNPEINVSESFLKFYISATDQLCSRTIFLYLEVIRLEFVEFCQRMVVGFFLFINFFISLLPVFNFTLLSFFL